MEEMGRSRSRVRGEGRSRGRVEGRESKSTGLIFDGDTDSVK